MIKCILFEQGKGGSESSTVIPKRLEIISQPTKLNYQSGERFDINGFAATLYYGVANSPVTLYATNSIPDNIPYDSLFITPSGELSASDTEVTISYIENGTTVNAKIPITVAAGDKIPLTTNDMIVNGSGYINPTTEITITIPEGAGEITINPMEVMGLDIEPLPQEGNSRTFRFTGETDSNISQSFTIIVSEGERYLGGTFENKFTISTAPLAWGWGEDGGTADESWFNGLNQYLADHTGASLRTNTGLSVVGTTKTVTLTTPVLGTTTHLIRVIGVDQDADNTVTFQTADCLAENTLWSTATDDHANITAAMWTDPDCKAKAECKNYKKALPGYNATTDTIPYIRIIKKGTCPNTNESRNGTPVYNDEDVWLPSEREMGLDEWSPLSVANSTTAKAECTEGKNFSYAYYTSNESRQKGNHYWERSRGYDSTSNAPTFVCIVKVDGTAMSQYYYREWGLAPAFVVGNTHWEWGEDGGSADEAQFNGLNNYLQSNSGSSLRTSSVGEILGTTKKVTLAQPVLGTTTHLIRVIGVDQDADNTVTFQTANCLNEVIKFSRNAYDYNDTTSAMWTDPSCKAKTECKNYKKALPGYEITTDTVPYIRIVKKGTCPDTDNSRNGTPEYNNEDIWLPSEREMGLDYYSPLSVANSTTTKAECTEGRNFSYAYYTSDENRIKKLGDSGNADSYWERGRDYNPSYSINVCGISINGGRSSEAFSNSAGLAPAFVVGTEPQEYSSLAGEALAGYSKVIQEVI